ncbi:MAG: regulatory protein RecX [Candidatus Dormibacteraceae bacterium]
MRQRSSRREETAAGPRRTQPNGTALDAGLRLLGRRAHSRVELCRKLGRRGHSPEEIDSALARLDALGYLNDLAFAEGLVRRRGASRGPMALFAELAARGVDRGQANAAVAAFAPEAQLASATHLAERLYAHRMPSTYRAMLEQVGTKLLRRGFSTTVVRAACRAVMSGTPGVGED